ncbi:MAG TPA: hypothetical protein VGR62_25405 [Candidatus Binatia bacterium]|nr:hypothetical protein [Candidatus Binatia bacterium]
MATVIVVARAVDLASYPESIAKFATPGQVFVSSGKRYEVRAISTFEGVLFMQIVDDIESPAWLPAWLFDVIDPTLPADWICNAFRTEPTFLMGPAFIAKDQQAYARMVELETEQVTRFWKRVSVATASSRDIT